MKQRSYFVTASLTLLVSLLITAGELSAKKKPKKTTKKVTTTACSQGKIPISATFVNPTSAGSLCLQEANLSKEDGGCPANSQIDFVPASKGKPPRALCVPVAEKPSCALSEDLLLELPYPHEWGKIFIPKEASCGGSFDLFLLLHGTVADNAVPGLMLGEGAKEKDRHLEDTVRASIDAKESRPVILADPTDVGSSCELYDKSDFDFLVYYRQLHALLAARGIRVRSISAAGHSGSACCTSAGMYRIADSFPQMKLWGTIDSCYTNEAYTTLTEKVVPPSTILFTAMLSGRAEGAKNYQEKILGASPESAGCQEKAFSRCQKSETKPWYIFLADGVSHDKLPEPYLREALRRFFPPE